MIKLLDKGVNMRDQESLSFSLSLSLSLSLFRQESISLVQILLDRFAVRYTGYICNLRGKFTVICGVTFPIDSFPMKLCITYSRPSTLVSL